MRAQIEILSEVFEEWLQIHDLDYDYWLYTQDEWLGRGEQILQGAELVIAFDNPLVNILNYTGPWAIEEELQDLAGGFGYYFEMGHHWNIGFYPLEDWPPLPPGIARIRNSSKTYGGQTSESELSSGVTANARIAVQTQSVWRCITAITASVGILGSIQMCHCLRYVVNVMNCVQSLS